MFLFGRTCCKPVAYRLAAGAVRHALRMHSVLEFMGDVLRMISNDAMLVFTLYVGFHRIPLQLASFHDELSYSWLKIWRALLKLSRVSRQLLLRGWHVQGSVCNGKHCRNVWLCVVLVHRVDNCGLVSFWNKRMLNLFDRLCTSTCLCRVRL